MLEEEVMDEARLLTIVSLRPTDKRLPSLTIQPLLCSDALLLGTDIPGSRPLEAVFLDADCFSDDPPDHIDVVSVAACTPQNEDASRRFRTWKEPFRDAFSRATTDPHLSRHRFATFVISNFGTDPAQGPAGLSGLYIPLRPPTSWPDFVSLARWGRSEDNSDFRWSTPIDHCNKWDILGHIASLNPFSRGIAAAVRVFGMTLSALPRDTPRLHPQPAFGNCRVRVGDYDADQSVIVFT